MGSVLGDNAQPTFRSPIGHRHRKQRIGKSTPREYIVARDFMPSAMLLKGSDAELSKRAIRFGDARKQPTEESDLTGLQEQIDDLEGQIGDIVQPSDWTAFTPSMSFYQQVSGTPIYTPSAAWFSRNGLYKVIGDLCFAHAFFKFTDTDKENDSSNFWEFRFGLPIAVKSSINDMERVVGSAFCQVSNGAGYVYFQEAVFVAEAGSSYGVMKVLYDEAENYGQLSVGSGRPGFKLKQNESYYHYSLVYPISL